MKKLIIALSVLVCFSSIAPASELIFSGASTVGGAYEYGLGIGVPAAGGTVSTDNIQFEGFYRKYVEETMDWGFSLSPIDLSDFPGTINFLFDMKMKLLKESSLIPNIVLGVNMVRTQMTTSGNTTVSFSFLDEGRIGFSKTFESYKPEKNSRVTIKKTEVYLGTFIVGNQIDSSVIYFGLKTGSMNLMAKTGDRGGQSQDFIGISFIVSE